MNQNANSVGKQIETPLSMFESLVDESEEISNMLTVIEDAGLSKINYIDNYLPTITALRKKAEEFNKKMNTLSDVLDKKAWSIYTKISELHKEVTAV